MFPCSQLLVGSSSLYLRCHPVQNRFIPGPGRGYKGRRVSDACGAHFTVQDYCLIRPSSLACLSNLPTFSNSDLCGNHVSKRPYGELGSVDRSNCLCCVSAESAFGPVSPGCGCDGEKVDQIVSELKQRMRSRGDTAQIQRAEQTLMRLDEVDAKLVRKLS
jgi:hypothetical protein